MRLFDVNVLIAAYRADSPHHQRVRPWFESVVSSSEPFGLADQTLSGFLRVVTHPSVFDPPEPIGDAIAFADYLRARPNAVRVAPGPAHWRLFTGLCRNAAARGRLVPDAWFAALAMESGCEWITLDRDFARFEGLAWRAPPG